MKALLAALVLTSLTSSYAEDMQKYLSATQNLVKEGKHEEALERFIWFHGHALEHDESMYGVRLSFALSYWKNLGETYPPALKAFIKMRDDKENRIRDGKGDSSLFHDVLALNRTLEDPKKSVALFEFVSKKQPAKSSEYWGFAKDVILEQKRYDIARKYIKDVGTEFANVNEMYDHNVTLYKNPQIGGERFKKYNENNFVSEVHKLIDLALALGDREAAIKIRDSALDVIDDERLKNLVPENKEAQDGAGQPPAAPESE